MDWIDGSVGMSANRRGQTMATDRRKGMEVGLQEMGFGAERMP
jgi:hypothetical protein